MKFTDGYYINPYIIWGELDYRGFASVGFEVDAFDNLELLKRLPGRKQVIWQNGQVLVFVSIKISDVCPEISIFNLSDKKLKAFYNSTLERISETFLTVKAELSRILNQEIEYLQDVEHFYFMLEFFNIKNEDVELNSSETIFNNLPCSKKINNAVCGFSMGDLLHNVIVIDKYTHNYREIFQKLNEFHLTVIFAPEGSLILVSAHAETEEKLIEKSSLIKSKILDISRTSYYEPSDPKESFKFFESCIPGWTFGKTQEYAGVNFSWN
jgi:hypothetical protein